ncbi:MAG TPA: ADOP family duplicated permease [Gemmatimonadaceae bacterium]|jgi:putative ABC transport system permease protein|nr:ADOP family duplicated permease [Gemmatimonadaceae bacterium]
MPNWRAELRLRLALLALAPAEEAELVEEFAQHLEQEFIDLAPRVGRAEAERQLLERLTPDALREIARERRPARPEPPPERGFSLVAAWQHLAWDVRFAIRRSRHRLGFTLVAVLSLALGIGVNVAVFSLVDAVLLRRAPVPHRERIAEIYAHQPSLPYAPYSYPDYLALRDAGRELFSQVSAAQVAAAPRDFGDHVQTLFVELVNGGYFPLLGLKPQVGRLLGPEDDLVNGAHPVVVLSNPYWHRAFNADPEVVGRQIRLTGRDYTIVGVAPAGYEGTFPGIAPALFAPIRMLNQLQSAPYDQLADRNGRSLFLKVRLAPGVSMARVRAFTASFTADMKQRYPQTWTPTTSTLVIPETTIAVNPMLDSVVVPAAAALMAVVALVLLVACANLASFLLAQARDRQREIAIRIALGASRWSLVRQLLVEALLLGGLGGIAGLGLSRVALGALLHADLPLPLPITVDVSLDARVLVFSLLAAAAAALLVGVLPALQATRPNVVDVIKSENTGGGPARGVTLRSALVVGQIAVSLVLLITAGLFLRSLQASQQVDPGFGHEPAGLVWFGFPPGRNAGPPQQLLLEEIESRLRRVDGVEAVGLTSHMPLTVINQQFAVVNVAGVQPPKGEPGFAVDYGSADSGLFSAAGVRLVRGRGIEASDNASAPPVAVVDEVMAKQFWPGADPIGHTFREDSTTVRVVGVARSVKVRSLGEQPRPFFFVPFAQSPDAYATLVARTARGRDADAIAARMVGVLRDLDPSIPVLQETTMARHVGAVLLPTRLGALVFALFAALALALAMIGVYGVVSYAVARRAREVGIRMALGAEPNAVVRLLMREGLVMIGGGGLLGLALAFAVTRVLRSLLSGVTAADPLAFILAPALLIIVGVAAAFLPALRSSRTDPVRVLRAD